MYVYAGQKGENKIFMLVGDFVPRISMEESAIGAVLSALCTVYNLHPTYQVTVGWI